MNTPVYNVTQLDRSYLKQLTSRSKDSHKGDFGHVLIIGGNKGMSGAARLAAEAALRTGAGLVSVATHPDHSQSINSHYPEIMSHGVLPDQLDPLLSRATVIALGPGLGKDDFAKDMMTKVLKTNLPKVIDADALTLLGAFPQCQNNWILTPHPGEAARLLNSSSVKAIQANRQEAITHLATLGGIWVLKGAGTLIKTPQHVFCCPYGNPGMASGGMGDALTGIISALVAQHYDLEQSATLGVLIHALAGDKAALEGERGLVASDLIEMIRGLINA